MYLNFEKDTKVVDIIPTYRFVPPEEVMKSPNTNPDNLCYCVFLPGDEECLNDSMMNAEPCLGKLRVLNNHVCQFLLLEEER